MKLTILNSDLKSEKFDVLVQGDTNSSNLRPTLVSIQIPNEPKLNLTVKFLLNETTEELTDFNFCYFENTNLLFFRFLYQWGIIDLERKQLKRNELDASLDFPFFYFHQNCILIVDDLFAETITLKGELIDRIKNEQPYEMIEFEDYFEFDIIGVGKRKLMKKRYT